MKATTLMTADDLWNLPDDGRRHELVAGELRSSQLNGFVHGVVAAAIGIRLAGHAETHKFGRVVSSGPGFVIATDPDTVRAPDVGFVSRERIDAAGVTKKYWQGAPDLAVEVVSPSDTYYEVDEKVEQWLDAGTKLVWVVNPRRRTVTVHEPGQNPVVLTAADTLEGGGVVAGFRCGVAEIFQ